MIYLGPSVVRKVDNAIHWIHHYPLVDNAIDFQILIRWIAIYPVDSAIQRLNNRAAWTPSWPEIHTTY